MSLSFTRVTTRVLSNTRHVRGVTAPFLFSRAVATSIVSTAQGELGAIKEAGTWKTERVITSAQKGEITVSSGDKVLNFCANNYLGLADDPAVRDAAKRAIDTHGFGMASVRFICGTQDIHRELEQKIAQFHGTDDAILFAACFDANAAIFETLLTDEDVVISDELNHASIIDGIRLCKAERRRYRHNDMADLEKHLQESQNKRNRLVATDGVFSMDGHVAPLQEINALAKQYDATVFIDECHATGFFGATGRGTAEYCGLSAEDTSNLIINSTLGKALGGGTGGYTTAKQPIIDLLRQRARPYLFSNSIAPPVVGASIEVFDRLSTSSELIDRIKSNTEQFRNGMTKAGFDIVPGEHPIVPIMLGDARLASAFADDMLKEGIYVIGFSYPVVPQGKARIRVQLSAAHTSQDVERAIDAFVKTGRKHKVIA